MQELLSSAQLKVENLLCKNKIFTNCLPSQKHENQCHRKWLKDVDVGIVAGIGLIRSLSEPKPG